MSDSGHEYSGHEYQSFLDAHRNSYGYGPCPSAGTGSQRLVEHVRSNEFTRLTRPQRTTPLDHAGAAFYSELQLQHVFQELQSSILVNPHSASQPGSAAVCQREQLVRATLDMCKAPSDQYDVAFTSGTTAALKLVAESLPWGPRSHLVHLDTVHNSVLGMREVALSQGAQVHVVKCDCAPDTQPASTQPLQPSASAPASGWAAPEAVQGLGMQLTRVSTLCRRAPATGAHSSANDSGLAPDSSHNDSVRLCVLPHECNFTGQQLDLRLADEVQSGRQLTWLPPTTSGSNTCRGRWLILLDAAKSCATHPPDLSRHPVDMVVMSYYKIMGYPTGLGALIVRKDALPLLTKHKRYFGGGTVAVSVADSDYMVRRPGPAGLEDGTPAFAAIAAASYGFQFLKRLGGFSAIHAHTSALCDYLVSSMTSLKHASGQALVVMYGREANIPGVVGWGPTVAFNLKQQDGSWVGYAEVARLAELHSILLRTGCFCNPGACAKYLGLTGDDMRENYESGHVCWDSKDLMRGRPTGAVRVSLGHVSTWEDVYTFIQFLKHYFLDQPVGDLAQHVTPAQQLQPHTNGAHHQADTASNKLPTQDSADNDTATARSSQQAGACDDAGVPRLAAMYVYPIKSCAAQKVKSWPVGPTGLLYDREWALLDDSGRVVTQKSCPAAALITPHIDLKQGTLTITAPSVAQPLVVPLRPPSHQGQSDHHSASAATQQPHANTVPTTTVKVCGDNVCGAVVAAAVDGVVSKAEDGVFKGSKVVRDWFQAALGIPCVLIQQQSGERKARPGTGGTGRPAGTSSSTPAAADKAADIGFANDGQYLLVNAASVEDVNLRIRNSGPASPDAPAGQPVELLRFRPNLVVEGLPPYAEDTWRKVQVGGLKLSVLGTCPRCEMLQVDQTRGTRGRPDVLLALAQYRRFNGRMHFGILLTQSWDSQPGSAGTSPDGSVVLNVGDGVTGSG